MKKYLAILMTGALLLTTSCSSSETENEEVKAAEAKAKIEALGKVATVRDLIDNNIFIDIDKETVAKMKTSPHAIEKGSLNDLKIMAANYLFYKHVTLDKDSFYTWDIKNGAEIGISEDIFDLIANNLKEANSHIKDAHAKGTTIRVSQPDEKYLNRLLEYPNKEEFNFEEFEKKFLKAKAKIEEARKQGDTSLIIMEME